MQRTLTKVMAPALQRASRTHGMYKSNVTSFSSSVESESESGQSVTGWMMTWTKKKLGQYTTNRLIQLALAQFRCKFLHQPPYKPLESIPLMGRDTDDRLVILKDGYEAAIKAMEPIANKTAALIIMLEPSTGSGKTINSILLCNALGNPQGCIFREQWSDGLQISPPIAFESPCDVDYFVVAEAGTVNANSHRLDIFAKLRYMIENENQQVFLVWNVSTSSHIGQVDEILGALQKTKSICEFTRQRFVFCLTVDNEKEMKEMTHDVDRLAKKYSIKMQAYRVPKLLHKEQDKERLQKSKTGDIAPIDFMLKADIDQEAKQRLVDCFKKELKPELTVHVKDLKKSLEKMDGHLPEMSISPYTQRGIFDKLRRHYVDQKDVLELTASNSRANPYLGHCYSFESTQSTESNFHVTRTPEQKQEGKYPWLGFEFKKHQIKPTHYSFHSSTGSRCIRSWKFKAFNEQRKDWDQLDEQKKNKSVCDGNSYFITEITEPSEEYYSKFRIEMTAENAESDCGLYVKAPDVYGEVKLKS